MNFKNGRFAKGNQINKGRKLSEEHKRKIRQSCTGQKRTEKQRENIRKSKLGHLVSEEAREKLRKANLGKKQSLELIDKRMSKMKGSNHPNWNGGKRITTNGYIEIKVLNHPYKNKDGYVKEHRLVMEKFLNRYLKDTEIVHHIDGNKLNNSILNLKLFNSHSEHSKEHRLGIYIRG